MIYIHICLAQFVIKLSRTFPYKWYLSIKTLDMEFFPQNLLSFHHKCMYLYKIMFTLKIFKFEFCCFMHSTCQQGKKSEFDTHFLSQSSHSHKMLADSFKLLLYQAEYLCIDFATNLKQHLSVLQRLDTLFFRILSPF